MRNRGTRILPYLCVLALAALAGGCSDDGIDSDEEARRMYLGLDLSIEKSLDLGFAGFNAASSANIDPQMTVGDLAGSLTVTGQVDQGASDNKGMRLNIAMIDYTDGIFTVVVDDGDGEEEIEVDLTYDTSEVIAEQPYLMLSLRNFPNGTLYGELDGVYYVYGDIEGEVVLDLTMNGTIMDAGNGDVTRVLGSTTVTGTADSGDGLYEVNLTI